MSRADHRPRFPVQRRGKYGACPLRTAESRPLWAPPLVSWSNAGSPLPFFLTVLAFFAAWFGLGRREAG